ncbi:MAG: transcription termination factor Rho [Gemmataceae bacterium]
MSTATVTVEGVLERTPQGHGFLRNPQSGYQPQSGDAYVPAGLIQRWQLREGWSIAGPVQPPTRGSGPRLVEVEYIQGEAAERFRSPRFDELTPIDPREPLRLETGREPLTTRVMDLLTPLGRGQRGLIVAPPRSGKTVLLQHIAQAIRRNYPEMVLLMLLIDERPEEVTDMRRSLNAEVIGSSSDRDSTSHIRTAELVMERARRLAEQGQSVLVLLDSLTRLARAYNKNQRDTGRTLSGGMDLKALEVSKKLFGAARAFEEGGSLTILGTALIETGSRLDEVIFQEFKGTGNMELVLDRKLADRRIYPAIDLAASGTRKEERLLSPEVLQRVRLLRRTLVDLPVVQAMELFVKKLAASESNAAFLERMKVA